MPVTFNQLLKIFQRTLRGLPDQRTGRNSQYSVEDAALGAFGVFFTQSPSFLAYQRAMQEQRGRNNAASLFGVERIPSDGQIRNLLDPVGAEALRAPFWDILTQLEHSGALAEYEVSGLGMPRWLCAVDGTQYFQSKQVHCRNCTRAEHEDGTHYAHSAMLAALVRPGRSEVVVLEPEFIEPQDGAEKQDCERKAIRRWVERNAPTLAEHHTILLADDLHCNQPFCEFLVSRKLSFIMTCKPDSHPTLYEEVERLSKVAGGMTRIEERVWTGKVHERWVYRYVNQVPLCAQPHALMVDWCELTITVEETGVVQYHNAFATNLSVNERSVRPVVAAGRVRWKIENENHNVLKNQGYHLEHNFGHGQQHLSTVLLMLILLAFLIHTTLQLCDRVYQQLRARLVTRKTFFDDIRALTRYLFFADWDDLLAFMLKQLDPAPD